MTNPEFDTLFLEHVYNIQNDLYRDRVGAAVGRAFGLGVTDDFIAGQIRGRSRRHRARVELGQVPPFRVAGSLTGNLILGRDAVGGQWVRIRPADLCRHVLGVAASGSGKSILIRAILLQLAVRDTPFWSFELHKAEMRSLVPPMLQGGQSPVVMPAADLRLNPLQAPPGRAAEWLPVLAGLLARILDVPPRGRAILDWALSSLYTRFGNLAGQEDEFPTIYDLYECIRGTQGLNASAREAILDRLGRILTGLGFGVLGWRRGWSPSNFSAHSVFFELGGHSEHAKQMIISPLIHERLLTGLQPGASGATLELFCVLDDAQKFLAGPATGELNPLEEAIGLLRSTGIGLGLFVQSYAGVPSHLIANAGTKVVGRLGTSADLDALGGDLGLTSEQKQYWRWNADVGGFLVQLSSGWRRPILVQSQHIKLPAAVLNVKDTQAPLRALRVIPAEEFRHWTMRPLVEVPDAAPAAPSTSARTQPAKPPEPAPDQQSLDKHEAAFLRAVLDHPGLPSSEYPKLCRLSPKRCLAIRERLVRDGYLKEVHISTGKRGRQAILLEPQPSANAGCSAQGGGA